MTSVCRALLSSVLLAAGLLVTSRADAAQMSCALADTTVLDFGQPVANPTVQSESTAVVRVHCVGDDEAAGSAIEICLLASPGGNPAMRRPPSTLRYGLFADSAHTRPLAHPASPVSTTVRLGDRPGVSVDARLSVYGVIAAGQTGLAGGLHEDRVPLQVRVATRQGEDCTTAPTRATGFLDVRAQLASGSCTVSAVDLDFGRAVDLARDVDGSTALGVTCTAGTPYSVALNGGTVGQQAHARRMRMSDAPATATITYQLYRDGARSQVWGDVEAERVTGTGTGMPQTLPVFARVPRQPTPPAGHYLDVVTATVTY
ncbi:Csu type fimbrial protein [Cognatilysobacter lacus]|uniref:Spore coat U domain-containing protein n=1 Tax=Cognatilysobacter lacus TaxID=1643323 RepID=A0A5D8Z830_9GAMM|nr:spore coat U domain-containing protein [Lysobacter lacus]TZF90979.1 spore coat U domain-containing protein [Lysobacter lacus]